MNFLDLFSIGPIYESIIKNINNPEYLFKLNQTCSEVKRLMDDNGFLNCLNYNLNSNFLKFYNLFSK